MKPMKVAEGQCQTWHDYQLQALLQAFKADDLGWKEVMAAFAQVARNPVDPFKGI
jgi:hypothetical protein